MLCRIIENQFCFLRAVCSANLKGSLGLKLGKASVMSSTIPIPTIGRGQLGLGRESNSFLHYEGQSLD